ARLIDVSHQIPAQDIMAGAWVLKNAAPLFPANTVHLVVIDPGVGTSRKPIALQMQDQFFVGPDNGIFSLLTENEDFKAVELTEKKFWQTNLSSTFHGRDIFAPVAAHICNGADLDQLRPSINELQTDRWASPIADQDGIQGWIIHIDRFGNLITNITHSLIDEVTQGQPLKLYVGNTIIDKIVDTFGAVVEGEPAAYIGSSGMLEIAINKGNAEQMLGAQKGAQI